MTIDGDLSDASVAVWNLGASAYAAAAGHISFYQATNAALLDMIEITPASRVLDLACGASSLILGALVRRKHPPLVLYGVDASKEMIDQARAEFAGTHARFLVGKAEDAASIVDTVFDAIYCNSALFLTDVPRTLSGVRAILAPCASFMFTLAEWQTQRDSASRHPKYDAINQGMRARGLPEKNQRGQRERVGLDKMDDMLGPAGMRIAQMVEIDVEVAIDDWKRLYAIDSFAMMSLPYLPVDLAKDVLVRAMDRLENVSLPTVRWHIYRAVAA